MNNKAQMNMLGMIIVVAVTLIIGVVLFQVVAQEVGNSVNTVAVENQSLTGAAVNGTAQIFTNFRAISDVIVFNATNDVAVPADNYTIVNNVVTDGALSVSITPITNTGAGYDVGVWTIDGTAQPLTYIPDGGGRAMANLIAVFFALAILVVAISPTLRGELASLIGK